MDYPSVHLLLSLYVGERDHFPRQARVNLHTKFTKMMRLSL
jgi:hypothetical protein